MAAIRLQVTIDGDRVVAKRLKDVEKSVKKVGEASTKAQVKSGAFMGTLIGNLTSRAMSLAIFALRDAARAIVDFGVASLRTSGEFEMLKIQMKAVGDAGQSAQATFDGIVNLAEKTPFQIQELAQAFVRLKGAGIQDVPKLLQGTADAVATFGGGTEELKGVALALAQIAAKGTLSGQELRQIAERNIPIYKILQQALGVTGDEFEKMRMKGIDSAKGLEAISEAFTAYAGNAEKAMDTFTGRLSNVRQAWTVLLSEVGDAANEAAKEGFVELEKSIKNVDAKGLGEALTDATTAVLEFGVKGVEAINNISTQLNEQKGGWWEIYKIIKMIGDELAKFKDSTPSMTSQGDYRNAPINQLWSGLSELMQGRFGGRTTDVLNGLTLDPLAASAAASEENIKALMAELERVPRISDEVKEGVTGVGNAWATWPTKEEMGLLGDGTEEAAGAVRDSEQAFESAGKELSKMVKKSKELGKEWKDARRGFDWAPRYEAALAKARAEIELTIEGQQALTKLWDEQKATVIDLADELDGMEIAMQGISGPEMIDALGQAGASSRAIAEGFRDAGVAIDSDLVTWEKFQQIVKDIGTEGFDIGALYEAISEAARSQELETAVKSIREVLKDAFNGVFSDIFTSILKGEDVDVWQELWSELAAIAGETLGATLIDAVAVAFGGNAKGTSFEGFDNKTMQRAVSGFVAIAGIGSAVAAQQGNAQLAGALGGAASGAAAGAAIGSAAPVIGTIIGAIIGAIVGYMGAGSGPDARNFGVQYTGGGFQFGPGGDNGDAYWTPQPGDIETLVKLNEVFMNVRAGFIAILEQFQDPELFALIEEVQNLDFSDLGYADELQSGINELMNVTIPRALAEAFRGALTQGFVGLSGDPSLQRDFQIFFSRFMDQVQDLPAAAMIEAIQEIVGVFVTSFELLEQLDVDNFMELMGMTDWERSLSNFERGFTSIETSMAALAELPLVDQAAQADKILGMIQQAADQVAQMMENILKVSKQINESIDQASQNIQYSALAQGIQFLRDGNIPSYAVADGTILGEIQGQMEQGLFGTLTGNIRDLFGEISSAASPEQVQSLTDQAMQQIQLLLQYGQQFGADNEHIQQYLRDFLGEFGINLSDLGFEFDAAGQYLEGSFTQVIRQLLEQLRGTAQGRLEQMQQELIDINERLVNAIERLIQTILGGVGGTGQDPRRIDLGRLNPFMRGATTRPGDGPEIFNQDGSEGMGQIGDGGKPAWDNWIEGSKQATTASLKFAAAMDSAAQRISSAAALLETNISKTVKVQRKVGARRAG